MKAVSLTLLFFVAAIATLNAQTAVHKSNPIPFQGTKVFCSSSHTSRYTVTIDGSKATITYSHNSYSNKLTGAFKKGKLYTNDPSETDTDTGGKYYVLSKTNLRVLNPENGDYDQYSVCK